MQKDRQPDWADTNLSLFGSDIEKKCKEAAANSEPQWDDAGVKVGLQIWRIEQFKVKRWPPMWQKSAAQRYRLAMEAMRMRCSPEASHRSLASQG